MEKCLLSYCKIVPNEYNIKFILYKIKRPIVVGMIVSSNFMNITKENWINQNLGIKCLGCMQFYALAMMILILVLLL